MALIDWRRFFGRLGSGWLAGLCVAAVQGADPAQPSPEVWLTNSVQFPPSISTNAVQAKRFDNLHAEALAGTMKVRWTPTIDDPAVGAVLRFSAGERGHWPARDWRSCPMARRGAAWETTVPVDSLDEPLIYFAQAFVAGQTNVSPMRLCRPRRLGLEQPTRIFWPFVEGFEESLEGWRWLAGGPEDGRILTSGPARNGKFALAVTISPGKSSVTIGTTRLRGWYLLEHGASGISLWMKTREGVGAVRFTLMANAFATNQAVAIRLATVPIQAEWRCVELPLRSFPRLALAELDFFAIEFLGASGREFLIDDLQMLGRWKLN